MKIEMLRALQKVLYRSLVERPFPLNVPSWKISGICILLNLVQGYLPYCPHIYSSDISYRLLLIAVMSIMGIFFTFLPQLHIFASIVFRHICCV